MDSSNNVIGKWTTPSITYKPSKVEMADVAEIYVTVSQGGKDILELDKSAATLTEDGFIWLLSQEQTSKLSVSQMAHVQVDYLTDAGKRYTTNPVRFMVVNSAVEEVI